MFNKTKALIISMFMMLTLISVGFSSWSISGATYNESFDGAISSDAVIDRGEFITDCEVETFEYCKWGFVSLNSGNLELLDYGEITVSFILDVSKCAQVYADFSGLSVAVNLASTANLCGFIDNITCRDSNNTIDEISQDTQDGISEIKNTFEFNNILEEESNNSAYIFTVVYKVQMPDFEIYSQIYEEASSNISFSVKAEITGINK